MSLCRFYSTKEVSIRAFGNGWAPNLRHARRANLLRPSHVMIVRRHLATEEARPATSSASKGLPSEEEHNRSSFVKGLMSRMDNIQAVVFNAGQRQNELTGYSGIEALKIAIEEQEKQVRASRQAVQKANEDYKTAIAQRSSSQKEVNELLQRKHMWSSSDLERFTTLYRSDHANEQAEVQAHVRLEEAEREADDARALLSRNILTRYHEEQIWSDKIRRASTWGTWGLMGFNIFLFIVVQLALEPWKRRRLVGNFEEKVRSVYKEEHLKRELVAPVVVQSIEQEKDDILEAIVPLVAVSDAVTQTEPEVVPIPEIVPETIVEEVIVENGLNPTTETELEIPILQDPAPVEPAAVDTQVLLDTVPPVQNPPSLASSVQTAVDGYTNKVKSFFSEEKLTMRQVDITTLALEGAACGAVVMAGILSLLYRR